MRKTSGIRSLFDIPRTDLTHHSMRVRDILYKKAPLNPEKQCQLARTMADKITNIDKAYGRFLVSEDLKAPHLAKIFLNRFKELTYSTTDWRKEKILSFMDDIDEEDDSN